MRSNLLLVAISIICLLQWRVFLSQHLQDVLRLLRLILLLEVDIGIRIISRAHIIALSEDNLERFGLKHLSARFRHIRGILVEVVRLHDWGVRWILLLFFLEEFRLVVGVLGLRSSERVMG